MTFKALRNLVPTYTFKPTSSQSPSHPGLTHTDLPVVFANEPGALVFPCFCTCAVSFASSGLPFCSKWPDCNVIYSVNHLQSFRSLNYSLFRVADALCKHLHFGICYIIGSLFIQLQNPDFIHLWTLKNQTGLSECLLNGWDFQPPMIDGLTECRAQRGSCWENFCTEVKKKKRKKEKSGGVDNLSELQERF